MENETPQLWNIQELAAQAATVLMKEDVEQASGRVSDLPTVRTIRYYATHGLLEKPIAHRGRTALYGRRHLMQLVAIKRMQARGVPLHEIQQRLLGVGDAQLGELAGMSADLADVARARSERAAFWADEPAEVEVSARIESSISRDSRISGVKLTEDVLLVLEGAGRELFEDELEAIAIAAEPLVQLLKSRRLSVGPATRLP